MEIAHDQSGPADLAEIYLPEIGLDDVVPSLHWTTVSPHAASILRGAAYLRALNGDPWRPQV